jgi:hypothetical protein
MPSRLYLLVVPRVRALQISPSDERAFILGRPIKDGSLSACVIALQKRP